MIRVFSRAIGRPGKEEQDNCIGEASPAVAISICRAFFGRLLCMLEGNLYKVRLYNHDS